jgi:hypothetical protein
MKSLHLTLLLLVSCCGFAQKITVHNFIFEKDTLTYKSIDYSKGGLGVMYINMYESNIFNDQIPKAAADCLADINNLYHTFYYFVGLPPAYTREQREKALAAFIAHIKNAEGTTEVNMFFNFDKDYSKYYQSLLLPDTDKSAVKRILIDATPYNICKGLL